MRRGQQSLSDVELADLQKAQKIVQFEDETQISVQDGIGLSVNLTPQPGTDLVGWRARKHAGLIDVDVVGGQPANRFWEAVTVRDLSKGGLVLNPDEFYILASREFVTVPSAYAAEMRAYDTRVGEFQGALCRVF